MTEAKSKHVKSGSALDQADEWLCEFVKEILTARAESEFV